MRVIRVPMTVDTPGATYNLRFTPPSHARIGACVLLVDSQAALTDHEVVSFKRGGLEFVTRSTVGADNYGIPLGHVACALPAEDVDTGRLAPARLQAWPGRLNDVADWQWLQQKIRDRAGLTQHEAWRLRFARAVPVENFALIPLPPQIEITIALRRITGATSITRAELLCIDFEDDPETFELMCGMPDLTDLPHWLGQALILPAAAGVQDSDLQRRWTQSEMAPHALRVTHPMAIAHSNDGAGTIAFDESYLAAVLLAYRADEGGRIWPSFADRRVLLRHQSVQLLQHLDPWRRFDRVVKWQSSLHINTETLTTAEQKDVRLSLYGLLRPQTQDGRVLDAA